MTMRRGGRHHWAYRGHWNEQKRKKGTWHFKFRATKKQKPKKGVKPGSRYVWKINATQYAVKRKDGTYQTTMVGKKRLVKADVKK